MTATVMENEPQNSVKRVVVIGASGDIGSAVVAGCRRVDAEVLAHTHSRTGSWPDDGVTAVQADLRTPEGIASLVESVPADWTGIDLLVAAVGGARPVPVQDLSVDQWRDCMQLNVEIPFTVTKALLGPLEKAGGSVVTISSAAAFTGGSFGPHYAAAKAAVLGLTRSLARDLGPRGIRVNCVAPGPVASAMTDELGPDVLAGLLAATALRRVVQPSEVADAVLDLARLSAVTGQTLVVDGGRVLR